MVLMEDNLWFKQMLGTASSSATKPKVGKAEPWEDDESDKRERERAFDIADCMEKGLAREVSTEFVHPLRRSSKLWRFHVIRSEDKLDYRLYSDDGDFLLFAKTIVKDRRIDIFMYNPSEDKAPLYDPKRPAFSVSYNEGKTQWTLVKEQCELCQFRSKHRSCDLLGKQQLASITQYREPIGDGIFNCMNINIPGLYSDGTRVVWCPMAGYGDLSQANGASDETLTLITKKPEWNEEVESLVLDFKGRCVTASAKNCQVALRQKTDQVICQYGKIGPSTFSLDFRFPLGVVQAFAISLSTMFWT
eukprot:gnl/MRDRNA2_/MRDRNA2_159989_c0_seq1.p1 gnl/MRDRNA2_/MRDRNA2_159989_c0~~gnl/MRDRNA2_/MRDRNA2_159989_c0_seq1.p1  ORF type:complete len:304 (+),score=50.00 gnl/MRDRNA2_/MRDRNA2_159989_c0_seq1:88-999(+)